MGRLPKCHVQLWLHWQTHRLLRRCGARLHDIPHVWWGRSPDSLHVRQRDELQPEIPSLRLELQRGLRLLPRLVLSEWPDLQNRSPQEQHGVIQRQKEEELVERQGARGRGGRGGGRVQNCRPWILTTFVRLVLKSEQLRAYCSSQRSGSKQWFVIKLQIHLNIYLFIYLSMYSYYKTGSDHKNVVIFFCK